MQTAGVGSLLACVMCMASLFLGWMLVGKLIFALSLVLMSISLTLSLVEIRMSVGALNLHLRDIETDKKQAE